MKLFGVRIRFATFRPVIRFSVERARWVAEDILDLGSRDLATSQIQPEDHGATDLLHAIGWQAGQQFVQFGFAHRLRVITINCTGFRHAVFRAQAHLGRTTRRTPGRQPDDERTPRDRIIASTRPEDWKEGEVPVIVKALRADDTVVVEAAIYLHVSQRKTQPATNTTS